MLILSNYFENSISFSIQELRFFSYKTAFNSSRKDIPELSLMSIVPKDKHFILISLFSFSKDFLVHWTPSLLGGQVLTISFLVYSCDRDPLIVKFGAMLLELFVAAYIRCLNVAPKASWNQEHVNIFVLQRI